jgi:cytochrome c-type biogenesis protein CcmH
MFRILVVLPLLWLSFDASAVIETYEFSTPELEQRYRDLSAELRCPKCQNQNIADSNAPISQDLRKLLYQQLEAGASDEEILDHMVARYGEFVRYRPRFSAATAVLWMAPVLLLMAAAVVVILALRSRRSGAADSQPLSSQDQQRLDSLLGDDPEPPADSVGNRPQGEREA